MTGMRLLPPPSSGSGDGAPQGVELRHLRYFVAVADAGTFTTKQVGIMQDIYAEPPAPTAPGAGAEP